VRGKPASLVSHLKATLSDLDHVSIVDGAAGTFASNHAGTRPDIADADDEEGGDETTPFDDGGLDFSKFASLFGELFDEDGVRIAVHGARVCAARVCA
jgi:hypothetical protein